MDCCSAYDMRCSSPLICLNIFQLCTPRSIDHLAESFRGRTVNRMKAQFPMALQRTHRNPVISSVRRKSRKPCAIVLWRMALRLTSAIDRRRLGDTKRKHGQIAQVNYVRLYPGLGKKSAQYRLEVLKESAGVDLFAVGSTFAYVELPQPSCIRRYWNPRT